MTHHHGIEGVDYHRHSWRTMEWRGGGVLFAILLICYLRGLPASAVSAWLALGLNFYVTGRMLYKRGRAIMGSGYGEVLALGVQFGWNVVMMVAGQLSTYEAAMWCAIAYGVFCVMRGLSKARTK